MRCKVIKSFNRRGVSQLPGSIIDVPEDMLQKMAGYIQPLKGEEKMKYHEQIKHPLWQKKRLEVLELSNFTCQNCDDTENQLHVHHPFYKKGAMIWDYTDLELQVLCGKCHAEAHAIDEKLKVALSQIDMDCKLIVLGYIHSIHIPPQSKDHNYIRGYVDGLKGCDDYIRNITLKLVDDYGTGL